MEALQTAQLAVKDMTASDAISYCEQAVNLLERAGQVHIVGKYSLILPSFVLGREIMLRRREIMGIYLLARNWTAMNIVCWMQPLLA